MRTVEKTPIDRKARMQLEPVHKQYREPEIRRKDFLEITPGMTAEEAVEEASRCLQCPNAPCVAACRVGNDIPAAMALVEQGEFILAAELYRKTNPLPEICGRVCPPDDSCVASCVLVKRGKGIDTRSIEAFVSDYQRTSTGVPLPEKRPSTGKKLAVIGSGPSGLLAAEEAAIAGHDGTVFDALPIPGGLLVYGIPGFKLEKDIVDWKIGWLEDLGVAFVTNTRIGEDISFADLTEKLGFDAVYLGTGAQTHARMSIEGEDLPGVHDSLDFINAANLPVEILPDGLQPITTIGRRVAVIGGGDTATDCVRTALRLGAENVTCYYRRTEAEMPGNRNDRKYAEEEGAVFEFLTVPVRFLDSTGDGSVDAMEMIRMELGEPDDSGRRRPVAIPGSEYLQDVDDVVLSIGFWADTFIPDQVEGIQLDRKGYIVVDPETGQTTRVGVFAGGDAVSGPELVSEALQLSRFAVSGILEYLNGG